MTTRHALHAIGAAMAVSCAAGAAEAQDNGVSDILEDVLREAARTDDLGNGFQALSVFSATPGITAATFYIDDEGDPDLNVIKLTPSHEFGEVSHGVRPYVQASFSYLDYTQDGEVFLADQPTRIELDVKSFTGLAAAGLSIDVAEGTKVRPILLGGYSYVSDSSDISGPFAEELAAAGKDIFFDAHLNSFLVGGAAEIVHERKIGEDINFIGNVRYTHFYANVFSASDEVLETDGDFGVLGSRAEFDGPTGLSLFGRELRWIGFASNTYLPGEQNDALGFSFFFELGGGIELVDRSVVDGIEGVSLRASAILGDHLVGWTAGASLEF